MSVSGLHKAIPYSSFTVSTTPVCISLFKILAPWEILLVIFAAVLVMSVLMLLPPAAVVIWRMRHVPQISLQGSV
uniref:Uncharacterized protein n=1 Tax=Junco hyemalis TaxID=40217 RepID=A0A8C5IZS5_JUNHY